MNAIVQYNNNPLAPTDMKSAMDLATMMARGKLVPTHLHNSPGDCLLIVEQALRWGMSPFAVAQCSSVIQGKLMFEGKLVSAAVHSSGILEGRLSYEFSGEGAGRKVVASGTVRGETKPRTIEIDLKDAKTSNPLWTRQPDQQLVYFATRAWARRHTPEVMLGVYSPEEMEAPSFAGTTLDAKPEPMTTEQMIGDAIPARIMDAPKKRTVREFLDALEAELAGISTLDEWAAIGARREVMSATDKLSGAALERFTGMIDAARHRLAMAASYDDPQTMKAITGAELERMADEPIFHEKEVA